MRSPGNLMTYVRFFVASLLALWFVAASGDEAARRLQVQKQVPPGSKEAMQCPAPGTTSSAGTNTDRSRSMGGQTIPKHDTSCYIDSTRAVDLIRSSSLPLIDVRSPEAFASFHIPGAMNMPPDQIKSKSFLLGKSVLVYGTGKSDSRLEELCAEMKSMKGAGDLKILSGGVLAWARAHGSTASGGVDELTLRSMAELTAAELIGELYAGDSRLIRVSQYAHSEMDSQSVRIDGRLSPETLGAALQRGKGPKNYRRIVLVGTGEVKQRDLHEVLISSRFGAPVFFYGGEAQQFEATLKSMNAQWAKRDKGPVASRCSFL